MSTDTLPGEADVAEVLGGFERWALQCHAASLHLIKSGILPDSARVARGTCKGVGGQHSWVILGDPYDRAALIYDVTLWSYDAKQPRLWVGTMAEDGLHRPHGFNSIWTAGCPMGQGDTPMLLDNLPDDRSQDFYDLMVKTGGTPDVHFWMSLFSGNAMLDWPAREILEAFLDKYPEYEGLVPVDIVGMLTDRNPDGLYR